MREIIPNQNFKHGRITYKKGKKYEVSKEDAEYFKTCGWVGDRPKTGKKQSLDIHDGQLGHKSEV